jgi:glycosyltransferase involved in cell wall biosynthesis
MPTVPQPKMGCVSSSPEEAAFVTAIIPTCGRPLLARRAILSALGQTYRSLDVVLVIDGPDGPTRELAAAMHEPRLRVIELKAKAGAAEARNIGVNAAKGEWMAFLDDDDEWLPQKVTEQIQTAYGSRAVYPVVSSPTIVRTGAFDWVSPRELYDSREAMSEYLFCRRRFIDGARYMQTSTLLTPRRLMLDIPFRKDLARHQDWDWLLRAAAHPGVEFHMHPEALSIFNVEEGRTSVGRSLDWEFSRSWAREMRGSFTPRAYSFFLATECISRAVKAHAGGRVYARLIWEFFFRGRATPRSLLCIAGLLWIPHGVRAEIKRRLRSFHSHPSSRRNAQSPQRV